MKDFLNRLFYRLQYVMVSCSLGGIIISFIVKPLWYGISVTIISILGYFLFYYLETITQDIQQYETDENGNAKPNYR